MLPEERPDGHNPQIDLFEDPPFVVPKRAETNQDGRRPFFSRRRSSLVAIILGAAILLATATVALAATFSNPAPITIPPQGGTATPYPSDITVSGLKGTVTDVNVTLSSLSHTFPDDVAVLLVGPGGQNVVLMSDSGCDLDVSNVTLIFDDEAATTLPDRA
jgi:hypothetical protein